MEMLMAWQRLLKGHMGLTQQPFSTEDVLLGVENVRGELVIRLRRPYLAT